MPLLFEPGEGWTYSCGIDWAGKMVERVNGGMRLQDFMKQTIWNPLGIQDMTFKLDENDSVKNHMVGLSLRRVQTDGKLTATPPMRKPNPKDDLGGGGLYTSPKEYIKVLMAILRNDGTLLKPETVEKMFTPQLPEDKYLLKAFEVPENRPMFTSGVSGSNAWNWGLGGLLNMDDVEGITSKGTMTWGGLPNLFWVRPDARFEKTFLLTAGANVTVD